jgi:hypothetical protein
MAKDALGHGSDTRGMRLGKTHTVGPHSAKVYKAPGESELVTKTYRNGAYQSKNDYHTDDMGDANGTALSQLNRWAAQDVGKVSNSAAASELASGAKTATIPTHDGMAGNPRNEDSYPGAGPAPSHWSGPDQAKYNKANGYNEHGSRHGYNPDAVNSAIASSNRAGRRIGGKEASAIHRLLKGR